MVQLDLNNNEIQWCPLHNLSFLIFSLPLSWFPISTFVIKFSENLQSIKKTGQSDKTLFMNTCDHLNKSNLLLENSYKITLISSIG